MGQPGVAKKFWEALQSKGPHGELSVIGASSQCQKRSVLEDCKDSLKAFLQSS